MESIPLKELSSLAEDIHIKTWEASQDTLLDMRKFLGIDKALQSIQGELLNNTSKLTEIDKCIKRDTKKLEEVKNDSSYTNEQRQLYRDRLDDLNTEKQARLKILSQNRKDFQTQVARIKQTIANYWRHGVVVITTAQLHSTKRELRFCAGSKPCLRRIRDL